MGAWEGPPGLVSKRANWKPGDAGSAPGAGGGRTPPRSGPGLGESGFRLRRDGEEWEAGASGCASPSLALPRRPIYRAFVLLTLISIRDERQCECTSPWFTSSIRCVFFVWILCGVVVLNSDQFMGELRPNVQFSSSIAKCQLVVVVLVD